MLTAMSAPSPTHHLSNQQNTLDEITNKVFNELLQRRVDAHSQEFLMAQQTVSSAQQQRQPQYQKRSSDQEELIAPSDDMTSEGSSGIAHRLRSSATEPPIPKARTFIALNKNRKGSGSSQCSAGAIATAAAVGNGAATSISNDFNKRPLIAKWKTGVKLQSTVANLENNG